MVEQITNTGQLFRGSRVLGVASTATAFGGTTFPPCAANDFSCAVRGTLALTVEPGEKATPPKVRDAPPVFPTNAKVRLARTRSWAKGILFIASESSNGASPPQGSSRRFQSRQIFSLRSAAPRRQNSRCQETDRASFGRAKHREV